MMPMVGYRLGHVYGVAGDASEGVRLLEQATEAFASLGFDWGAMVQIPLGYAYVRAGRVADGLATGQQARTVARDRGERLHEAHALWLLGEATAAEPRPDLSRAAGYYGEALDLATHLGTRPLIAHCHVGLGRLEARTAEREQARQHLTDAMATYQALDMSYWLPETERLLQQLV
jgi:hypothetical protein